MGLIQKIKTAFGYDAIEKSGGHRRSIATVTRSEDRELTPTQRRKLIAGTRDIRRNFELAAWAIRKHLDYVAAFSFRSMSGKPEWDREVARFIRQRVKPQFCDAAGKKSLRKMIRLAEALRTVDGDVGLLKLRSGELQFIEGDRIKNPATMELSENERWTHGVKTNKRGRALQYGIWGRINGQRLEFERTVNSSQMYLHGYFDRADQVRGISPVAASLNRYRDTYENLDYALAKAKVAQLMGLVLKRNMTQDDLIDDDECCDEDEQPGFQLNPNQTGPFTIDLSTGEEAELLQSNQPSSEFQAFMQVVISIALKSLDIPYFFFDESKLNFFGGKVALSNYLISCADKRDDNIELLNWWTRWQVGTGIATGELNPGRHGLAWEDVDDAWRWIPRGVPWWDKGREIAGDILSVHAGFEDYGSIVEQRTGQNFEDVIDRIAEQQAYMREKGVVVTGPKDALLLLSMAEQEGKGGDDAEG